MIKQPSLHGAYRRVDCMMVSSISRFAGVSGLAILLANCASDPSQTRRISAQNQREIGAFSDKQKYGSASPRVVADGQAVPKGGGRDHVGRPYSVAGRTYTPRDNPNYSATGASSWYGDAFHGRKTANGEVYDKHSYTAAHPTMPLPSYARVTNLRNNRSIIVRVNDRGPFHGGRIIDVSERVASALEFKHLGTARVQVDYVRRASTVGSDDRQLFASLRTDGALAQFPGGATPVPNQQPNQQPILVASNQAVPGLGRSVEPVAATARPASAPALAPVPAPAVAFAAQAAATPVAAALAPAAPALSQAASSDPGLLESKPIRRTIALPVDRPFDLGTIPGAGTPLERVNNGQITPLRASVPSAPARDRVAAVYFAPAQGFKAVFGSDDPLQRLKPGRFDPKPQVVAR